MAKRGDDSGSVLATLALVLVGIAILSAGGYAVYVTASGVRGVRNNNPGNLKITALAWRGKVPREQNSDGTFEQFRDTDGVPGHVWGIRAAYMDIRGDVLQDGLNTVAKLITEYAPKKDKNDTAAYIAAVSKAIGKPATAVIGAADLKPVLVAIIAHENAGHRYPDADIQKAISLA